MHLTLMSLVFMFYNKLFNQKEVQGSSEGTDKNQSRLKSLTEDYSQSNDIEIIDEIFDEYIKDKNQDISTKAAMKKKCVNESQGEDCTNEANEKYTYSETNTESASGSRRQKWENGEIDYMGIDRFENIMKRLNKSMDCSPSYTVRLPL